MRKTTYSVNGPVTWFKWITLTGVLSAFGFMVWYASIEQDKMLAETQSPKLIKASATPIKVRAENPGGMRIPHRDKKVFDLLADQNPNRISKTMECKTVNGVVICGKTPVPAPAAGPATPQEQAAPQQVASAQPAPQPMPQPMAQPTVQPAPTAQPAAQKGIGDLIANFDEKPTPAPAQVQAAPNGKWGVQLASYASKADAEAGVVKFNQQLPGMLDGMSTRVQAVTVKGREYHRLQFFGLNTKAEGQKLCGEIKQKGHGCLYVKF